MPPMSYRRRIDPLLHGGRDFRLMWGGQALSLVGSQLTTLALPLVVLRLTGSALDAGLVATVRLLVLTAARLPAGAAADRWSRRTLMLAADGARAVVMAALGLLVLSGELRLPLVLTLAAVDGICTAFFSPAQAAAIRHLAGPGDLAAVLGLNQARGYGAALAGPPLGGLLFAAAAPAPFFADTASYLVSLGCLAAIHTPLGGGQAPAGKSLLHDAGAGLRLVATHSFLLTVMLWAALINFATAGISFGIILVAGGSEHSTTAGAALAIVACGGIAGALAAPMVMKTRPARLVVAASLVTSLACAAIAAAPVLAVAVAAVTVIYTLGPLIAVPLDTRMYALIPDDWTGRVQGAFFLAGGSIYPLGSLAMGVLAQHGSIRLGYLFFSAVLVLVLILTATPAFLRQLAVLGETTQPLEGHHAT